MEKIQGEKTMEYETKEKLKEICYGATGLAILFGGIVSCGVLITSCDNRCRKDRIEEIVSKSQDLEVEPISIQYQQNSRGSYETFSMVTKDSNGKNVLCRPDSYLGNLRDISAVVQANINEGNHQRAKIRAYDNNGSLIITYFESGDFHVGFKPIAEDGK